jgi:type II secretion system protein C
MAVVAARRRRGPVKRILPVVIAAVIALFAFASAFALNTGLKLAFALPDGASLIQVTPGDVVVDVADSSEGTPPTRSRALTKQQYIDGVLARNIFDSAAIGKAHAAGPGEEITDLSVILLATMVAEPAEFSSALIAEKGKDDTAAGYGIGSKLQDAEITAIEQKRVTLKRGDGRIEYLTMDEDAQAAAAPSDAAPAATTGDAPIDGITQIDETHYQVDSSLIGQYLGDLDALTHMARAIPHRGADGEIDGYRLSGIRRNSPLSQLGVRNGDVIHSVNGTSLASMQEAMSAFQSLQSSTGSGNHFSFDVTRRGTRQSMEYDIK